MATNDTVTPTTDVKQQLALAKKYIQAKDYHQAKLILNKLDHPTASQWFLKIEEIEMFSQDVVPAARAESRTAAQSRLLEEVTGVFLTNDWTINAQMGNTIIVEKKKATNSLGAAALIFFFGIIGMFIVLIAIATAKVERITLSQSEDGTVRLTGNKMQGLVIHGPQEAVRMARSIKKGATYGATLALGIGSTILWMVLLQK